MAMGNAHRSATLTGQDHPVIGILSPLVVGGYISEVISGVTGARPWGRGSSPSRPWI
jgi:hypothetical protein